MIISKSGQASLRVVRQGRSELELFPPLVGQEVLYGRCFIGERFVPRKSRDVEFVVVELDRFVRQVKKKAGLRYLEPDREFWFLLDRQGWLDRHILFPQLDRGGNLVGTFTASVGIQALEF